MKQELVAKMLSKCSSNQMVTTHQVDLEKFADMIVNEAITLLKKGDPDFNNFSERLVRQHFGVK